MRVALLVLVASAGCLAELDGASAPPDDPADGFSPLARAVIDALRERHADGRGLTWDVSTGNTLPAGWLVQTPGGEYWDQPLAALPVARSCSGLTGCDPDFDLLACASQADCVRGGTCRPVPSTVTAVGQRPRSLCAGHSDVMVDQIHELVASAEALVEISSLTPPDGRFEAGLRNALTLLSARGKHVAVRYIYGLIPGAGLAGAVAEPANVLPRLARALAADTTLDIAVAAYRVQLDSWDHAKIIAVDQREAIVGGHNLLTRHYLQQAPAYDLSMRLRGDAAAHASRFVEPMWRFACSRPGDLASTVAVASFPAAGRGCEPVAVPPVVASTDGATRVIDVGRLGGLGDDAADTALVTLLDAATRALRLSQQDIGGLARQWPEPVIRALVAAAARGVDIQLVISNIDAFPDQLTGGSAAYSNGWTPEDVVRELARYAQAHPDVGPPGTDLAHALCTRLHVASLRHGDDDTWPDGARFANHAKLIVADDRAFYLGSQNLYPSNLSEYGFLVDDEVATRQLLADYFDKLWAGSRRTAMSCPQ